MPKKSRAKQANSRAGLTKRCAKATEVTGGCREVARKTSELPHRPY